MNGCVSLDKGFCRATIYFFALELCNSPYSSSADSAFFSLSFEISARGYITIVQRRTVHSWQASRHNFSLYYSMSVYSFSIEHVVYKCCMQTIWNKWRAHKPQLLCMHKISSSVNHGWPYQDLLRLDYSLHCQKKQKSTILLHSVKFCQCFLLHLTEFMQLFLTCDLSYQYQQWHCKQHRQMRG